MELGRCVGESWNYYYVCYKNTLLLIMPSIDYKHFNHKSQLKRFIFLQRKHHWAINRCSILTKLLHACYNWIHPLWRCGNWGWACKFKWLSPIPKTEWWIRVSQPVLSDSRNYALTTLLITTLLHVDEEAEGQRDLKLIRAELKSRDIILQSQVISSRPQPFSLIRRTLKDQDRRSQWNFPVGPRNARSVFRICLYLGRSLLTGKACGGPRNSTCCSKNLVWIVSPCKVDWLMLMTENQLLISPTCIIFICKTWALFWWKQSETQPAVRGRMSQRDSPHLELFPLPIWWWRWLWSCWWPYLANDRNSEDCTDKLTAFRFQRTLSLCDVLDASLHKAKFTHKWRRWLPTQPDLRDTG